MVALPVRKPGPELSNQAEEIRVHLQEIFDAQIDLIEQVVIEAKELGQVGSAVDAREAARSIVALIEGRVLLAKLLNDPSQLELLWRNCLGLLQSAGAGTPRWPADP